jgi:hypothetical protein
MKQQACLRLTRTVSLRMRKEKPTAHKVMKKGQRVAGMQTTAAMQAMVLVMSLSRLYMMLPSKRKDKDGLQSANE